MAARYNLRPRSEGQVYRSLFPPSVLLDTSIKHLPDASCTLFHQFYPLTFFDFHSLPTELRLRIWQLTLPRGRKVKIAYQTNKASRGPHLSKLLGICSESRQEVLRQYCVFFQRSHDHRSAIQPAPIFFSAKRDLLVLDFGYRNRHSIFSYATYHLFKEMAERPPNFFAGLRTLELHDFMWSSAMKFSLFFDSTGRPRPSVLERFGNLESVVCVRDERVSGWDGDLVEGLREDLQLVFLLLGGKVPVVEVKSRKEI